MKSSRSKSRSARRTGLVIAIQAALALGVAVQAQAFPPTINLSSLDGTTGFRLDGVAVDDRSGYSVSTAGDINGDGIDDLVVGAPAADPNGSLSGSSYVVFGRSGGFSSIIHLNTLDGSTGFRLDGVATPDFAGVSVSAAGDINGDGIDDLIVGANTASPNGTYSGSSYVVFGRSSGFASTFNLSTLDGSTGFRLDGVAAQDYSGSSVSAAGDINGDGVGDVIVGAIDADPNGLDSGSSYVVFGHVGGFASTINLSTLDGSNGFRLDGVATQDRSGISVSAAGDINSDGIADVIVGAAGADPNGSYSGSSYVVFGHTGGFSPAINLSTLNGTNGFRLDGVVGGDRSGRSVSAAGDINGDGIGDVIAGAYRVGSNGINSGSSYVVFGSGGGFAPTIKLDTLNGSNGFRLDGEGPNDRSGRSVSAAGDINGDGIDDLIVGASFADPFGSSDAGSSYVVFGRTSSFASPIILNMLNGINGFRLDGVAAGDRSGRSVSAAGDINGDGIGDMIVGADLADPNGSNSGSSYVVFGVAPAPTALQNGVAVSGLSGFASSNQFFSLRVPARASNLAFRMLPGLSSTGDADLYVRFGVAPTTGSFDCRPFTTGSAETCLIAAPNAGTYYAMVHGFMGFTDVMLTGSFTPPNPGADFNADTHADILWRHRTAGNNAMWLMNGRTANKGPLNPVAQAAQKVQGVGDFDGDGKADIFWRNTAIGTNSIWLMNARTPSFGPTQTVANLSFNVAGIGDFDGDGKADVLWRNATTGTNSIWLMNGRTPGTGPINATATSWKVGGVGDFNGDGKADILWRNSVNGRNSIWLMNGRTISFGATSQVANLNIVVSGIGDFDGDGKSDILWRNTTNGVNPLWLMNGRTPSFGTTSTVANLDLTVVQVSDFDGDGKADILWRNLTTGNNSMWLMNGRTASFGVTSPVADLNWEVVP